MTVIESENPLKTAKEFYDKIAFGGFDEAKGEGKIRTTLRDKTVIFFRVSSRSGGPAVDINIKASKEPTKIVSQKIHFILGGSK